MYAVNIIQLELYQSKHAALILWCTVVPETASPMIFLYPRTVCSTDNLITLEYKKSILTSILRQQPSRMVFDSFLRFRRPEPGQKKTDPEDEDIQQQRPENHNPLWTISQLPPWYEPSPFILTGYRPASRSWYISLSSWAYVHNESGNIHSHLIPGVILLLLVGQGSLYEYVQARHAGLLTWLDWMVVAGQMLAGACCLLVSTVYHTGLNHSEGVARCWLGVDYGGILLLLLGDFVSGLHFGFYCAPSLKMVYCALVCSLLSPGQYLHMSKVGLLTV